MTVEVPLLPDRVFFIHGIEIIARIYIRSSYWLATEVL